MQKSIADVIHGLETQIVEQIQIRDSLIIEELLAAGKDAGIAGSDHLQHDHSFGRIDHSTDTNEQASQELEKSVRDLHSEAFELCGLEYRANSMARISSQRLLVQDLMLTGGIESDDPLIVRGRQLMLDRDRRVKDLTVQLKTLNEMRDRIDSMRRERAALAIKNRALAEAKGASTNVLKEIGSNGCVSEASAAFVGQDKEDVIHRVQVLEKIATESRRHFKIRSIFSSLVSFCKFCSALSLCMPALICRALVKISAIRSQQTNLKVIRETGASQRHKLGTRPFSSPYDA